jgi:replicative DNA helicase
MSKERLIPQDKAAEQSVLGSLLMDGLAKFEVIDLLPPEAFFDEQHREIYDAILTVDSPDTVTVAAELRKRGKLDVCGGEKYLTKLVMAVPSAIYVRHYAEVVERTYQLRRFMQLPSAITDMVYQEAADVAEVWNKIRCAVDAVQPEAEDQSVLEWSTSLNKALLEQDNRQEDRKRPEYKKLKFQWQALSMIDRLYGGMLTIVAAESSAGKTAFAEGAAEYWAERGFNVVFVHLELSHQIMLDRRSARQSGILISNLADGACDQRLVDATNRMAEWPGRITYIHAPGWTASRIAAVIETRAARVPVDILIVDYLTKIAYEPNRLSMNTAQSRGQQVERLKTMAERLDIPVLLLSQLNRDNGASGKRKAGRLRDSGEIEEKANVVITIDRNRDIDDVTLLPVATVAIEKNTTGDLGTSLMYFRGERFMWTDITHTPLN